MAEAVSLVDPLGVQFLVILEADGRAVPDHVDPRMRVKEELCLLRSRRSRGDRVEPARAEVLNVI